MARRTSSLFSYGNSSCLLLLAVLISCTTAWVPSRRLSDSYRRRRNVVQYQDNAFVTEQDTTDATPIRTSATSTNRLLESLFENDTGPIYFFDGTCNFCNDSVSLCYDWDTQQVIRFAPLQSPTGRAVLQHFGRDPQDHSRLVVLTSPHTMHLDSDAVLAIASIVLPPQWQGLAQTSRHAIPAPVRNRVYRWASRSRHWFGSVEGPTCRVDMDPGRFVDQPDGN